MDHSNQTLNIYLWICFALNIRFEPLKHVPMLKIKTFLYTCPLIDVQEALTVNSIPISIINNTVLDCYTSSCFIESICRIKSFNQTANIVLKESEDFQQFSWEKFSERLVKNKIILNQEVNFRRGSRYSASKV